jgi:hypothetical protein
MRLLPNDSEPGHLSDVLKKPDALKFSFEKKAAQSARPFILFRIELLG